MPSSDDVRMRRLRLAARIRERITQHTRRHDCCLRVRVLGGRVLVRGTTESHYGQQLALNAVLRVLRRRPQLTLDWQVTVAGVAEGRQSNHLFHVSITEQAP